MIEAVNEAKPTQSIRERLSGWCCSWSLLWAQMVPKIPTGTFTKKRKRQSRKASMRPLSVRPPMAPTLNAIWLTPRARPSSFAGKASVMIAALLAKRDEAPRPWKPLARITMYGAVERPVRSEPMVNMVKPTA